MDIREKVIIVTGGGSGIGEALCRRFAADGARAVVAADINLDGAEKVAREIGGVAVQCDVSREKDVMELVKKVEKIAGPVDMFCSNAGILLAGDVNAPDRDWRRSWETNLMGHVYAARAVIPGMIERGGGYLLQTASAAGLINAIGGAPYAVSKYAAVGLAENMAITYGDRGIRVSVVCPQLVRTPMIQQGGGALALDGVIEPEQLADAVVQGVADERFLILPHPEVRVFLERKVFDYDRWLRGMRRLQDRLDHDG